MECHEWSFSWAFTSGYGHRKAVGRPADSGEEVGENATSRAFRGLLHLLVATGKQLEDQLTCYIPAIENPE